MSLLSLVDRFLGIFDSPRSSDEVARQAYDPELRREHTHGKGNVKAIPVTTIILAYSNVVHSESLLEVLCGRLMFPV